MSSHGSAAPSKGKTVAKKDETLCSSPSRKALRPSTAQKKKVAESPIKKPVGHPLKTDLSNLSIASTASTMSESGRPWSAQTNSRYKNVKSKIDMGGKSPRGSRSPREQSPSSSSKKGSNLSASQSTKKLPTATSPRSGSGKGSSRPSSKKKSPSSPRRATTSSLLTPHSASSASISTRRTTSSPSVSPRGSSRLSSSASAKSIPSKKKGKKGASSNSTSGESSIGNSEVAPDRPPRPSSLQVSSLVALANNSKGAECDSPAVAVEDDEEKEESRSSSKRKKSSGKKAKKGGKGSEKSGPTSSSSSTSITSTTSASAASAEIVAAAGLRAIRRPSKISLAVIGVDVTDEAHRPHSAKVKPSDRPGSSGVKRTKSSRAGGSTTPGGSSSSTTKANSMSGRVSSSRSNGKKKGLMSPAPVEEKEFKDTPEKSKMREMIIKEILSTEETYVRQFALLVTEYLQPIQEKKLYTKRTGSTLEASTTSAVTILQLHQRFLNDLRAAKKPMSVFIEYAEYMKAYFPYVQNFPHLVRDMMADDINKSLRKFLQKTTKKHNHQSIAQLLILPVQRIPRYELLLAALEKETPELHEDMIPIRTALAKIRVVAARVDECQKQSENSACLFWVHRELKDCPEEYKVLTPTRLFVAHHIVGEVKEKAIYEASKATSGSKHPHKSSERVFLFNDSLMVANYKFVYQCHYELEDLSLQRVGTTLVRVDTGIEDAAVTARILQFDDEKTRDEFYESFTATAEQLQLDLNELFRRQKGHTRTTSLGLGSGDDDGPRAACEQVNLYLRIRPFTTSAEKELNETCLVAEDNIAILKAKDAFKNIEKVTVFDDIFDQDADQAAVFDRVGQQTLGAVFAGYNSAILAYGNTGAGKTHTMFGEDYPEEKVGLVPRMLNVSNCVL